ncbi:hypothetical protein PROFUN_01344 [Planoprotostelium fungivorum]|uniref:Uncharacterized protein n=1 Tax=Planoprotostelium fungivorum TaxID=1890364 RepID=A0A2P6NZU7_9EUKA|nr:hypothetical protein PROFUN_01344 [Planoprotostelium fungivorum]
MPGKTKPTNMATSVNNARRLNLAMGFITFPITVENTNEHNQQCCFFCHKFIAPKTSHEHFGLEEMCIEIDKECKGSQHHSEADKLRWNTQKDLEDPRIQPYGLLNVPLSHQEELRCCLLSCHQFESPCVTKSKLCISHARDLNPSRSKLEKSNLSFIKSSHITLIVMPGKTKPNNMATGINNARRLNLAMGFITFPITVPNINKHNQQQAMNTSALRRCVSQSIKNAKAPNVSVTSKVFESEEDLLYNDPSAIVSQVCFQNSFSGTITRIDFMVAVVLSPVPIRSGMFSPKLEIWGKSNHCNQGNYLVHLDITLGKMKLECELRELYL